MKAKIIIIALLMLAGCTQNSRVEPTDQPLEGWEKITSEAVQVEPLLTEVAVSIDRTTVVYYSVGKEYVVNLGDGWGVASVDEGLMTSTDAEKTPFLGSCGEMQFYGSDVGTLPYPIEMGHGRMWFQYVRILGQEGIAYETAGDDGPASLTMDNPVYESDPRKIMPYQEVSNIREEESGFINYDVGKFGVFSNTGEILTEAIYDDVFNIDSELLPVQRDGYWGYVNDKGEEVIPTEYLPIYFNNTYPYPVIDGQVILKNKDGQYGMMDTEGKIILEFEFDMIRLFPDGFSATSDIK